MTPAVPLAALGQIVPWFLNHVWQSMLCGVVAVLLVGIFRKNRAAVRYRLWFAASVKFLIPLSLFVGFGTWFDRPPQLVTRPQVTEAVSELGTEMPVETAAAGLEVFPAVPGNAIASQGVTVADGAMNGVMNGVMNVNDYVAPFRALPVWSASLLFLVWLCGVGWTLVSLWRRWASVRAAVRKAVPMEFPQCSMETRMSSDLFEPCVVGIFRPVLLLPEGVREALSPEQLEGVVRHESEHVLRRDNLTATLHMVTEVLFWFLPPVRWIGQRLVDERERACDEAVVRELGERATYAEAIVEVCRRGVRPPLPCVSGVGSSNLTKRIDEILNPLPLRRVRMIAKVLAVVILASLICVPFVVGMITSLQIESLTDRSALGYADVEHVAAGLVRIAQRSEDAHNKVVVRVDAMLGESVSAFPTAVASINSVRDEFLERKSLAIETLSRIGDEDAQRRLAAMAGSLDPAVVRVCIGGGVAFVNRTDGEGVVRCAVGVGAENLRGWYRIDFAEPARNAYLGSIGYGAAFRGDDVGPVAPPAIEVARDVPREVSRETVPPPAVIALTRSTERANLVTGVQLGWRDRSGQLLAMVGGRGLSGDFDVSPDGLRIAVTRPDPVSNFINIWLIDLERDGATRPFTSGSGENINPIWSPDGKRIAFTSFRSGNADIFIKEIGGTEEEIPFATSPDYEAIKGWSPDGRYILYVAGPGDKRDLYARPATGKGTAIRVVGGPSRKEEPQLSFDGKWLAYTSDESGEFEVYVAAFPAGDRKINVSSGGGGRPRWTGEGNELLYMTPDTWVMAVDIYAAKDGTGLDAGPPRQLFRNGCTVSSPTAHRFGVTADGQRFLVRVNCTDAP